MGSPWPAGGMLHALWGAPEHGGGGPGSPLSAGTAIGRARAAAGGGLQGCSSNKQLRRQHPVVLVTVGASGSCSSGPPLARTSPRGPAAPGWELGAGARAEPVGDGTRRVLRRNSWCHAVRWGVWDLGAHGACRAGAKYPSGSRERDPQSRGLGIALLLSCSLCTELYLQRRATKYPRVMSEPTLPRALLRGAAGELLGFLSASAPRG